VTSDDAAPKRSPFPLRAAAVLVVVEAVLLAGYGLVLLPAIDRSRLALGLTTPLFFVLYGAALAAGAWFLVRRNSAARAPVVLAQLIQLGVAWSFQGGGSTLVAVGLAGLAVLVLVGIFHPASVRALSVEPAGPEG